MGIEEGGEEEGGELFSGAEPENLMNGRVRELAPKLSLVQSDQD